MKLSGLFNGPEINFWHITNKKIFKNIKERDKTVVNSFLDMN